MAIFSYRVARPDGSTLDGQLEGEEEHLIRAKLEGQGFLVFRLQKRGVGSRSSGINLHALKRLPFGEFLIFKGAYPLATWATALSVIGLLVTAIFLLTVTQRVFHGPLNNKWSALPDLTLRERLIVIPATALMFIIGICPQLVIGKINATVLLMVEHLKF